MSAGSAGRREWLERSPSASLASPNHFQRGGGGAVMPSSVVRTIVYFRPWTLIVYRDCHRDEVTKSS